MHQTSPNARRAARASASAVTPSCRASSTRSAPNSPEPPANTNTRIPTTGTSSVLPASIPPPCKQQVATGAGDWDVLTWVNENAPLKHTPLEISQWSDWTHTIAFHDVEMREWYTEQIKRLNPAREDLRGTFDYLDLDDFVSFGGVA